MTDLAELFKVPEREPNISDQLIKAAHDIVVHPVDIYPGEDLNSSHLCYLLMRTIAHTTKNQLRQLAALVTLAEELRDTEGHLRPTLEWLCRQAFYDAYNSIGGDLDQLIEIASKTCYGSVPSDLEWLRKTMTAARDLLKQILPGSLS